MGSHHCHTFAAGHKTSKNCVEPPPWTHQKKCQQWFTRRLGILMKQNWVNTKTLSIREQNRRQACVGCVDKTTQVVAQQTFGNMLHQAPGAAVLERLHGPIKCLRVDGCSGHCIIIIEFPVTIFFIYIFFLIESKFLCNGLFHRNSPSIITSY